jgi:CHAD domain-containing protein
VAYRIDPDRRVAKELVRVAREQVRGALSSVRRIQKNPEPAIHKARQHSKKLRALFRLIRPELEAAGTYKLNDDIARQVAKQLSTQRDAEVALATLRSLEERNPWAIDPKSLERLHRHLEKRSATSTATRALGEATKECIYLLGQQADLIDEWRFRSGARRAIEKGFSRTLRTARKWMSGAAESKSPEDFHRWRKHVKYHLYHLRLVAPVATEDLSTRIRQAYRLQKLLGEHHDLMVLDGIIAQLRSPARRHRDAIRLVIRDTAAARETQALRVGGALLAQSNRDQKRETP